METLLMSAKERKRLVILAEVRKKRMSLAQAGRVMGMSYRQAKRIWGRYLKKGDAGLVHGLRGKARAAGQGHRGAAAHSRPF
jgi:molybdenum-dependent DNA-binding transcriptional regulator ModE